MFKTTFSSQKFELKEHCFKKQLFFCVSCLEQYETFLTCNYLLQIITCIRHIKLLFLSFITYTFISSSLPFIQKINFLSFKCHVRNFWNGPIVTRAQNSVVNIVVQTEHLNLNFSRAVHCMGDAVKKCEFCFSIKPHLRRFPKRQVLDNHNTTYKYAKGRSLST